MNMRPKTKRRLVVLISAVVLVAVALSGLVMLQKHRNQKRLMTWRNQGMERYQAGDYEGALEPLSKYHTQRPDDPETRYAFAVSRSKVPDSGGYLAEAIQHLQYYTAQRPGDMDAKHLLLELYNKVGWNTEAVQLADELLDKDGDDLDALKYKAMAKYRLQRYDEALALSERLNKLSPLDLDAQLLTYQTMYNMRRPVEEVLQRAQEQRLAHPDDARFELLQGYAFMYANQLADAEQWLDSAAARNPVDVETVLQLARLFDQLQKFDKAQKVLEQASDQTGEIKLTRALLHRLWRGMRFQDVVDRTATLNSDDDKSDTQLLAYRAYALYELRRMEDARPIVSALEKRQGDDNARGWALALKARYENPEQDIRQKIEQYQAAISRAPQNAVIRYLLGEAYLFMQENELALDSWQKAIELDPSWALPRSQRARLMATTGRVDAAMQEAQQAMRRSPTAASVVAYSLATYYKARQTGADKDYELALKVVQMLQDQVPAESETLPIYVALLVRDGQRDKAIEAMRAVLSDELRPPMSLLVNLISVNRRQGLGLEEALFDRTEQLYGQTPELAYARAMDLHAAGQDHRGVAHLKSALTDAPADKALSYRLALAHFMEVIADPAAKDGWIALGEEFPDKLEVQSAVLSAESPREDRQFMRRTIDRVRALTGEQAYTWRIAQARWLLNADDGAADRNRDVASAIVLLTEMLRTSPTLVEPRLLLSRAMEITDNPTGAEGQLTDALKLRPESAEILIELARIYQSQAKFDSARSSLDTAGASAGLTARQRLRVAMMYAQQAEYDRALALLEAIPPGQRDTNLQILVAQLYRQTGAFDKATAVYEQLLEGEPQPATIRAAADLYASRGEVDRAMAVLDRLSQVPDMTKAQREMARADFAERHQTQEEAIAHYQAAIATAPKSAEPYLALVAFYLRQEQFAQAATVAESGLEQLPDNAALKTARERSNALARGDARDMHEVIDTLASDPRNDAAVRTLRVIDNARANKEAPDATLAKLVDIANRYPQFLPVHKEVVRRYLAMGQVDTATGFAQRAMDAIPTSADAARMATEAYAAAGQSARMLTAAQAWRRRSLENPQLPDAAIAEAELAMGRPQAALAQIEPYIGQIQSDPSSVYALTNIYARALLVSGREQEVEQLLLPLTRTDARWRVAWLNLLAVAPRGADTDAGRIRQIQTSMDKDDPREQLALGRAWYDMAQRYGYRPGMEAARTIFQQLSAHPDADSGIYLLLGSAAEGLEDWNAAEAAYREAIAKDPQSSLAMNQLAYALLQRGGSLDEARSFAQQAVEISPSIATIWDTLARIHAKQGNHADAIKAFEEAVRLQPGNLEALIGLASSLIQVDRKADAWQILQTVENLLQGAPPLPLTVNQQLQEIRKALQG